jgi:hypothetical protein
VGSVCDNEHLNCSLEDFAAKEFNKIFIQLKAIPGGTDIRFLMQKTETVSEMSPALIHLMLPSVYDDFIEDTFCYARNSPSRWCFFNDCSQTF